MDSMDYEAAAQAVEPAQQSVLVWMFQSLGLFYGVVLPLVGFLIFIGACLVVALSKRPSVIAAYLVFIPLPFLIGLLGAVQGCIASYRVVAMSAASPQPSELAVGVSTALFSALVGLLVTFPSFFVVALGLFIRTVCHREPPTR